MPGGVTYNNKDEYLLSILWQKEVKSSFHHFSFVATITTSASSAASSFLRSLILPLLTYFLYSYAHFCHLIFYIKTYKVTNLLFLRHYSSLKSKLMHNFVINILRRIFYGIKYILLIKNNLPINRFSLNDRTSFLN